MLMDRKLKNPMETLKSTARAALQTIGGGQALLFVRFLRKLPSLWIQEQCAAKHRGEPWSDNRIFVQGDGDYYPIYCPDDLTNPQGGYLRTYNIFCHQASAWYMRREVCNFIRYAKRARRFADVGSAEGFYGALFASIHGANAEILSVDCGSETGCNPFHSPIVIEQNRDAFGPARWDFVKAFVTDSRKRPPSFALPEDCMVATLPEVLADAEFIPDLIKFDIESSEHEVLLDSLAYLQDHKPVLIVEVHNEFLVKRGLEFRPVLAALRNIGYCVVAWDDSDYLKADNCHVVMVCSR